MIANAPKRPKNSSVGTFDMKSALESASRTVFCSRCKGSPRGEVFRGLIRHWIVHKAPPSKVRDQTQEHRERDRLTCCCKNWAAALFCASLKSSTCSARTSNVRRMASCCAQKARSSLRSAARRWFSSSTWAACVARTAAFWSSLKPCRWPRRGMEVCGRSDRVSLRY